VTSQVALLLEALATIFTADGQVLGDVIADMGNQVLADLVGVSAVGPFAVGVDDRTLDMLIGQMELFMCQCLSCINW
jgi:hypothetical protein